MRRDNADSLTQGLSVRMPTILAGTFFKKLPLFASLPLLVACNSLEPTYNEFFGEEPMPERVQVDEQELEGGSTPNLSTVPMQRPSPTPAEERERLRRSLQDDHSRTTQQQQEPAEELDAPSGERTDGDDRTSLLDETAQSYLAIATENEGALFTGLQLAQITINQDVVSDSGTYNPSYSAGNRELAGVIYFRHGSNALDSRDRGIISEIARVAERRGASVQVVGHASAHTPTMDQERFERVNQAMSRQRAEAVVDALRQAGLEQGRIRMEALGVSGRVYAEFMPTGEAGNRRVEIFLLY
ncbi:OmpA family protein [Fodinicurvata sediminis]|uniref:OmpA family protein n=1 Tax=Fodinicurvata sediminis TaxID=1121832 RepID=UPI0003B46643|nr:OmpA family protein [Fodinicurvata sediminis]